MTNPTDAAIERHIWPDGDWHHETCRCGAAHPRDAGILARSTSTALEELDFHNRRANAAIARAAAAERVVDALQDDDMLGVLAEAMHSGYRHAIDGPEAMPIHRLITQMDGDEWGRYVYYVGSHLREWIDARTNQPATPRQVLAIRRDRSRMDMRLRVAEVNGIVHNGRAMLEVVLTNEPRTIGEPPVEVIVRSQTFRESDFTRDRLVRVTVEPQP
jgi:hypothetical protein